MKTVVEFVNNGIFCGSNVGSILKYSTITYLVEVMIITAKKYFLFFYKTATVTS